jgi:hypothetical protein
LSATETSDIAVQAREKFLATYPVTAADIADGGARLKEKIKAAEQNAEQQASDYDGKVREAAITLARLEKEYEAAQAEGLQAILDFAAATNGLAAKRRAYAVAHSKALSLGISTKRIPSIAVLSAQSGDEGRDIQLALEAIRQSLSADL